MVDQGQQRSEFGCVRLDRRHESADMVHHEADGKTEQAIESVGEFATVQLELDVPPERRDVGRDRLEHLPRDRAAGEHVKSRSAHAEIRESCELVRLRPRVDDHHTASRIAERRHGIELAAVVEAVGGGLDDDHALGAQRGRAVR